MLGDWGVCLENGKDFVAAKGEKDRTPGRLKTRGFDLLIKEELRAGLLAASTVWDWMLFIGEEPQSGGSSPGVGCRRCWCWKWGQWMDWLDLQNLAVKACAGEGGKKRGREEETGSVGAG